MDKMDIKTGNATVDVENNHGFQGKEYTPTNSSWMKRTSHARTVGFLVFEMWKIPKSWGTTKHPQLDHELGLNSIETHCDLGIPPFQSYMHSASIFGDGPPLWNPLWAQVSDIDTRREMAAFTYDLLLGSVWKTHEDSTQQT